MRHSAVGSFFFGGAQVQCHGKANHGLARGGDFENSSLRNKNRSCDMEEKILLIQFFKKLFLKKVLPPMTPAWGELRLEYNFSWRILDAQEILRNLIGCFIWDWIGENQNPRLVYILRELSKGKSKQTSIIFITKQWNILMIIPKKLIFHLHNTIHTTISLNNNSHVISLIYDIVSSTDHSENAMWVITSRYAYPATCSVAISG